MAENHTGVVPQVRSHSQLSAYLECGREYQLGRVLRLPRRPGAWFPGGTAVHATIERFLRESIRESE